MTFRHRHSKQVFEILSNNGKKIDYNKFVCLGCLVDVSEYSIVSFFQELDLHPGNAITDEVVSCLTLLTFRNSQSIVSLCWMHWIKTFKSVVKKDVRIHISYFDTPRQIQMYNIVAYLFSVTIGNVGFFIVFH